MRYSASEKREMIKLVEQLTLNQLYRFLSLPQRYAVSLLYVVKILWT